MTLTTSAEEQAQALLDRLRQTPMRRGALSKRAHRLKTSISSAIASRGVPWTLAQRVAFQLAFKFHAREIEGGDVWAALGDILREELLHLTQCVGMAERRAITALPKLSARQIEEFLDELTQADRRIARTILNAAVEAADPLITGRRYLAEYRLVARQLRAIDPAMARTLANASFAAGMPLSKAMEHLERFTSLRTQYQDNPDVARLLARAGVRGR